jgi:hypothetical protein
MSNKIPYAPPPAADDVDEDSDFNDLPADVALDFNDRTRSDEYEPEDDDGEEDLWDEDDEEYSDDLEY